MQLWEKGRGGSRRLAGAKEVGVQGRLKMDRAEEAGVFITVTSSRSR